MFLDKILRWTNSSQFIDEYSRVLFDEFVHTNNSQVAFNKAREYAEQNKMSYNEIYKGNEMVAEKIDSYIASIQQYSDDDVGEMTKLIENLSLKEDKNNIYLRHHLISILCQWQKMERYMNLIKVICRFLYNTNVKKNYIIFQGQHMSKRDEKLLE